MHEKGSGTFEFREIFADEADQAVQMERICFPPHEACPEAMMRDRVAAAPEMFLVAVDGESGKLAGLLTGLSTDEQSFRDEFFSDVRLHNPQGANVMILGLEVLPEYRGRGLARELMSEFLDRERSRGRRAVILTCLESKVKMYEKMGFHNDGISQSSWGGEQWFEMSCVLNVS